MLYFHTIVLVRVQCAVTDMQKINAQLNDVYILRVHAFYYIWKRSDKQNIFIFAEIDTI